MGDAIVFAVQEQVVGVHDHKLKLLRFMKPIFWVLDPQLWDENDCKIMFIFYSFRISVRYPFESMKINLNEDIKSLVYSCACYVLFHTYWPVDLVLIDPNMD